MSTREVRSEGSALDLLPNSPRETPSASLFFRAAEFLEQPLYFVCSTLVGRLMTVMTPGEFGNYDSWTREFFRRCFVAFAIPALSGVVAVGSLAALPCKLIGDLCLGKQPYLYLPGNYQGEKQKTFATFNMSTLLPPMTLIDGVAYSQKRLKKITHELKDFHFVCGQEVDGASARFFSHELKNHFSGFYTYLGKSNIPLLPSGLFFACKEPVLNVTVIPFKGPVQKTIKRELVIFELADYCVAIMHLDGGSVATITPIHLNEIHQAKQSLLQCKKPVILCGDFNEDRYVKSAAYLSLTEDFVDCITEQRPCQKIITCTDALAKARFGSQEPVSQESIDYITVNKNQNQLKLEFLGTDYHYHLSDHSLVKGKIV